MRLELLSRLVARLDATGGEIANAVVREMGKVSTRRWLAEPDGSPRDLRLDIELELTFLETAACSR